MASRRAASKGKVINPHFWVFCEGKTEEAYIIMLRSQYRMPIEIVTRTVGSQINKKYIENFKKGKPTHKKDLDFLVYDADVEDVLENLKSISSAILIVSNPCIELWFLLHYKNQTAKITGEECIRELIKRNNTRYQKGIIDKKLAIRLSDHQKEACKRASTMEIYKNPSTNINVFIEILEKANREGSK